MLIKVIDEKGVLDVTEGLFQRIGEEMGYSDEELDVVNVAGSLNDHERFDGTGRPGG